FLTPSSEHAASVLPLDIPSATSRFNAPRGIAINTDPASANFGRVYIANSAAGFATNIDFGPARALGDGIYILNADLSDALGQGDAPRTGGLTFFTNSDLTPYRLTLDRSSRLYICDFSAGSGSVYAVDPDVSSASGTNVLGGPSGGLFPLGTNRYHGR